MNYIIPDWPAPENIKAYTTTRHGWSSRQSQHEKMDKESQSLKQLLNLPREPTWLTQTHSAVVIEALPENTEEMADGTFAQQPGQVCVVITADCLPILICDKQGTYVAALHAGWRGLSNGIIEAALEKTTCSPQDLLVWLGPAIGPQKFEVGNDVYEAFVSKHTLSSAAFKPHTEGKWLADLYRLAKIRLHLAGITQIYGGNLCTYTQDDLFFSYRRDKGQTGRMASLIWLG